MKRDIFRLALKDFQIQAKSVKNYIISVLIIVIVFSLMGSGQNLMLMPMVALIILYRFINMSMYEDEKNNTLRMLASLPVRRETIVAARYLSTGVFILILSILLGVISALKSPGEAGASTAIVLCMFFVYVIMMSVYMPIGFRLGYIRAVNINRFIFIGIFILLGFVPLLLGKTAGQQDPGTEDLAVLLAEADHLLIVAGFAVITLLLYIISMKISVLFFKKRALF